MTEPTGEQCNANRWPIETEHGPAMACWYPQMGGYSGACLVIPAGGCFDVYVWHDGDFPFDDEDEDGRTPIHLHHCSTEQFIEFGLKVKRLMEEK